MRQRPKFALTSFAGLVLALSVACENDPSRDAGDTDVVDADGSIDADVSVDADTHSEADGHDDTGSPDTAAPDTSDTGADTGSSRPTPSPKVGLDDSQVLNRVYRPKAIAKSYEKETPPPKCDESNPDVMILEPSDKLQKAFNRNDKRIFCLKPGDYSGQYPDITTSGTRDEPRWIRYYNPGNPHGKHPWDMADPDKRGAANRVIIGGIYMRPGKWWRVDRIRFHRRFQIIESAHVVVNRVMFYKNPQDTQIVIKRSDDVTVQNSVLGKTMYGNRGGGCNTDANTISIQGTSDDVHVVGNELFDFYCGDGVQTLKIEKQCRGFVVQNNDIYTTPKFNRAGHGVENGIDFKCGPADTSTGSTGNTKGEDWVLVEGNRLWGDGSDMIFHWPAVSGVVVRQNFVWNVGEFAWQISAKKEINREHHVYDNVLYETGGGFKPRHIDASLFARNIFVRAQGSDRAWAWFSQPKNNEVRRNVFIETDVDVSCINKTNTVESNAYYGSKSFDCSGPGDISKTSASAANHGEFKLDIKTFTGPKTKTLPGARPTASSPHATWLPSVDPGK